jgi:hypothetical protein
MIVDENGTKLNIPLQNNLNQNTCTDNSECRSDNASHNDDPNAAVGIHAQIGGDDIICGNRACVNHIVANGYNPGSAPVLVFG